MLGDKRLPWTATRRVGAASALRNINWIVRALDVFVPPDRDHARCAAVARGSGFANSCGSVREASVSDGRDSIGRRAAWYVANMHAAEIGANAAWPAALLAHQIGLWHGWTGHRSEIDAVVPRFLSIIGVWRKSAAFRVSPRHFRGR